MSPIQDALLWALERPDSLGCVSYNNQTHRIYVKPIDFYTFVVKNSSLVMPGGGQAIRNHLVSMYEGSPEKHYMAGSQARTIAFDADKIGYSPFQDEDDKVVPDDD